MEFRRSNPYPNHSQIERWVYKEIGEVGLRRKVTKQVYSVQFKFNVLHFLEQIGASCQGTAIEFKMNNPVLIVNRNSKFKKKSQLNRRFYTPNV